MSSAISFPSNPGPGDRHFYGAAFEEDYHTPDTYFVPLIVSAGADEALGMEEPNASGPGRHGLVLTLEEAADNLTSAQ
ncbi:hypothetical protein [Caulifigura coniformis]|nr:hypothetical protein [Caulifigura coniformis]